MDRLYHQQHALLFTPGTLPSRPSPNRHTIAHMSRHPRRQYRERTKRTEPTYGDLFYSREGTYFGIAAEAPRNYRVCLGQRMVLIRPNSQSVDFHYLRYWLNSPVMEAHIHGFRDGSVAERLNLPTIRILPVLLPSLPKQRAIAHILRHPGRQNRTQPSHERNARRNGADAIQELVHRLRPRSC